MTAYTLIRDEMRLRAAVKWLHWYADHLNPDGTMYDYRLQKGTLQPMGDCDSTDSYAATFLEALRHTVQTSRDRRLLAVLTPRPRKRWEPYASPYKKTA